MKKLYSLAVLCLTSFAFGQISLPTMNTAYTQNFDDLANTGTGSLNLSGSLTGWSISETGANEAQMQVIHTAMVLQEAPTGHWEPLQVETCYQDGVHSLKTIQEAKLPAYWYLIPERNGDWDSRIEGLMIK